MSALEIALLIVFIVIYLWIWAIATVFASFGATAPYANLRAFLFGAVWPVTAVGVLVYRFAKWLMTP